MRPSLLLHCLCVHIYFRNKGRIILTLLISFPNSFEMAQAFQFLCGNYNDINFVFATKFGDHAWHYFDEQHSLSLEHDTLHKNLNAVIKHFKKPRTIEILLNEAQARNYFDNGKFTFKNTDLQTCTFYSYCFL